MGTTTKGYPYPEDTDPTAQGAQAIKALANAIDTGLGRAASGSFTLSIPSAQAGSSVAVTFPVGRFTAAPAVMLNRSTGIGWASMPIAYTAGAQTASGFTATGISAATGGAAALQYVAVQAP